MTPSFSTATEGRTSPNVAQDAGNGARPFVPQVRHLAWDLSDDPCYFCAMGDLARARLEGNAG